jgi:malate dehydrogenase (oxaloacetate-decarboxylating)(NADP+)
LSPASWRLWLSVATEFATLSGSAQRSSPWPYGAPRRTSLRILKMLRRTGRPTLGLLKGAGALSSAHPGALFAARTFTAGAGDNTPVFDISKYEFVEPILTKAKGISIIHDPTTNKGTGFPLTERDRLGIRGLVPPRTLSLQGQVEKILQSVRAIEDPLQKAVFMNDLCDRNETLFYRILIDNLPEFAPIVYTPVVGLMCQKFGTYFRRARGMYFSSQDRGMMASMLYNWPRDDVEVIVVTDGSRILGLGDLGANGMGIPIGKLMLYVAAGGIDPKKVLPCLIDAGTDNVKLREDPYYLGLPQPRLKGDDYFSLVHEFVNAVKYRWPNAMIQFEDFSSDKAGDILEAYRYDHRCFNDDIQGELLFEMAKSARPICNNCLMVTYSLLSSPYFTGTGVVALASLMAAVRTQGQGVRLRDQRIVVCGAGSAGLGVSQQVYDAMLQEGAEPDDARARIWVLDKDGLLGPGRDRDALSPAAAFFTRDHAGGLPVTASGGMGTMGSVGSLGRKAASAGASASSLAYGSGLQDKSKLADVVASVQPTILLGLTGVGGTFSETVVREMGSHIPRPIIFPMSNPTSHAECTAEQAYTWTDGRAVVASGSPFAPCIINGKKLTPSQSNNVYVFPGIGLGVTQVRARRVTDRMLFAAAKALSEMVTQEQLDQGMVLPPLSDIRKVSARVAAAVAQSAIADGIVDNLPPSGGSGDLVRFMSKKMYNPAYVPIQPLS